MTGRRSTSARRRCGRSSAKRSCCASLDNRKGVPPLEELGFSATALERDPLLPAPSARHDPRRRSDGLRKDDDALLGADVGALERTNIITIEDPVEYSDSRRQPDADQRQDQADVRERAAIDPAAGPRRRASSARSATTKRARIAMQAAQTGHLVLSTLHTDDAPSCVTRLTDIGIEPYVERLGADWRRRAAADAPVCAFTAGGRTRPTPETLRAMSVTGG